MLKYLKHIPIRYPHDNAPAENVNSEGTDVHHLCPHSIL